MRGNLGDKVRLQHIFDAILEIESYLTGKSYPDFLANSMMRFAIVKQLEIIGEAANHISSETKELFSNIPWSQIIGLRNVFVHEYFGIDLNLTWQIIISDLPDLKEKVQTAIQSIE